MRGFKRTGPNSDPVRNDSGGSKKAEKSQEKTTSSSCALSSPSKISRQTVDSRGDSQHPHKNINKNTPSAPRARYCHYFVNQGKCHFEERTGKKCQFQHEQAPMCNSGISCTRPKCMFSHPKIQRNQNPNQNFLEQMMSTWQMMNPWMTMTNPWNQRMTGNKSVGQQY